MCSRFARHIVVITLFSAMVLACATSTSAEENSRLFGFLPNYTTVDERSPAAGTDTLPLSTRHLFKLADLNSFDPVVFPFMAFKTALGGDARDLSYGGRYATALADNAVGSFMTTAVVPSLTHQDPRYFRSGEGGVWGRVAYAASRSVVTQTQSGHTAFNISKVGGNLAAAGLSNIYYPQADRTVAGTMSRWGAQMVWSTVSNELREFWPDIRAKLHKH